MPKIIFYCLSSYLVFSICYGAVMDLLQTCHVTVTDPSQGLSWSLGAVYIDMSFP
jgi:hypothetical protein